MVKKIKKFFKNFAISRMTILTVVFFAMSLVIIQRIFSLQIIHGEEYEDNFQVKITKERTLKSARGEIYDTEGELLAYNESSYSLTLEDNGDYATTAQRQLSLNSEIYRIIQIVEAHGDSTVQDFHIRVNETGNFVFDINEGVSLDRFRADVFGRALIDQLKPEEKSADAQMMMKTLVNRYGLQDKKQTLVERFGLTYKNGNKYPYKAEDLQKYDLPEEFSNEEILKIVIIRYQLGLTSFKKFMPVTIATDISSETRAAIMENQSKLQGVNVEEDSKRVYVDSVYFAPLLGYTGKPSSQELEELQEKEKKYTTNSIIGKAGIEQYMESYLQGTDGKETVYVDSLGKVLEVDEKSRIEPSPGNKVYLSINKKLQIAYYNILEQRIAGILVNNLQNRKTFDRTTINDNSNVPIPVYDVYNALINNSVIDITHFTAEDASDNERYVQQVFEQKQQQVFDSIRRELTGENPAAYRDLDEEMQGYMSYIVNELLMKQTEVLAKDLIDRSDKTYLAWTVDESISLQEYLTYAASQNWIDISKISYADTYLDSNEVYQLLADYISEKLTMDLTFGKSMYHYMLQDDQLSPENICHLLYDQGILSKEDGLYEQFVNGNVQPYDLIKQKLNDLEITPAQLALDPCSGSIVVTDPATGRIRACVSYPGYDNNRLSNQMDTAYYRRLNSDLSSPFYNKATQERTAPGSTFKLVTIVAGLNEKVISDDTTILCDGIFGKEYFDKTGWVRCWNHYGHGTLDVRGAIKNSCNDFLCTIAYDLGLNGTQTYSEKMALSKLQSYCRLFNLDKKSGIEVIEAEPQVTDSMAIPSSIGQGTHNYTTTQLARYVTTLANRGTSYDISILEKVTDKDGKVLKDFQPAVESQLDISDSIWEDVHSGMRSVITNSSVFGEDFPVEMYGKTGTAQQIKTRPNHGLFIGFTPGYAGGPEMAMAIRIAYGYSSTNVALVAKDMLNYTYQLVDEAEILTGTARVDGVTTSSAQRD